MTEQSNLMKKTPLAAVAAAVCLGLVGTGVAVAAPAGQGTSSSQSPYLVGERPGVKTTSILTVGDTVGDYPMVGIPDGLGAYDNGDGTFTVLMNHELGDTLGAVHAHGATGAFISQWKIRNSLEVISGEDLIKQVKSWNGTAWETVTTAFGRFCSADLADRSAFHNPASGKGTQTRLYLTGEETGAEGRATATVVDGADAGTTYILPWLGKASWENLVAMPNTGDKTVVVGLDDSGGGQVYVYVGEKKSSGNDVERAGLTGGTLYGLKISGVAAESDSTTVPTDGASFALVEIPGAATMTGAQIEAASTALGVTALSRPEDGAWDPTNPGGFYFATTASFRGVSRVWHLDFSDVSNVIAGGTASIALAGPAYDPSKSDADQAGPRMMDNLTVNARGQVLVQEDPGGTEYLAGIFQYEPTTGAVARIAGHDPDRFTTGAPDFLTIDEESSGIIPVPFLGAGKYLLDAQSHYPTGDPTTVQGGQLLLLQVPPGKPVK